MLPHLAVPALEMTKCRGADEAQGLKSQGQRGNKAEEEHTSLLHWTKCPGSLQ